MGAIRSRPVKRGNTQWFNEDLACDAHNWLRFDPQASRVIAGPAGPMAIQHSVFRRWVSDGSFISRLEVGWSLTPASHPQVWDETLAEKLLKQFLDQKVGIDGLGTAKTIALHRLPAEAQKAYRLASSKHGEADKSAALEAVRLGPILLYVELKTQEMPVLPAHMHRAELGDASLAAECEMSFGQFSHAGLDLSCCFVRRLKPAVLANEPVFRNLRLNLMRMHAECHGLDFLHHWQQAGQMADDEAIDLGRIKVHGEKLLVILRPDRGGKSDPMGFRLARAAIDELTGGRINTLLFEFNHNFQDPTERMLRTWHSLYPTIPPTHFIMNKNTNKIVSSGSGANISVAQGAGNSGSVTASIQNIQNGEAFKKAVSELETAVNDARETLEPRQVIRLEDKIEDLKKPDEDPAWYKVTAKGLLEAANAVKDIAAPVAAAAMTVAKLFGIG